MRKVALACVLAAAVAGCSGPTMNIVGHWKAEDFRVQSLNLPIGPEMEISDSDLFLPGADLHFAVESLKSNGREVTLNLQMGLGWTFFFESSDRMYIDVPLLGKVHYQRTSPLVKAAAKSFLPVPTPHATDGVTAAQIVAPIVPPSATLPALPAAPQPRAESEPTPSSSAIDLQRLIDIARAQMAQGRLEGAQLTLNRASVLSTSSPALQFEWAALASLNSDSDAAVRHLDAALRGGLRPVGVVESDPRLAALHEDVRYRALVARYK